MLIVLSSPLLFIAQYNIPSSLYAFWSSRRQILLLFSIRRMDFDQFLPRKWLFWQFSSKPAVDRFSLRFEFQLPHSNPILVNNMLQK